MWVSVCVQGWSVDLELVSCDSKTVQYVLAVVGGVPGHPDERALGPERAFSVLSCDWQVPVPQREPGAPGGPHREHHRRDPAFLGENPPHTHTHSDTHTHRMENSTTQHLSRDALVG